MLGCHGGGFRSEDVVLWMAGVSFACVNLVMPCLVGLPPRPPQEYSVARRHVVSTADTRFWQAWPLSQQGCFLGETHNNALETEPPPILRERRPGFSLQLAPLGETKCRQHRRHHSVHDASVSWACWRDNKPCMSPVWGRRTPNYAAAPVDDRFRVRTPFNIFTFALKKFPRCG